jgi:ATP-binding cassette subfamily B (MDR/TAP) protein 7
MAKDATGETKGTSQPFKSKGPSPPPQKAELGSVDISVQEQRRKDWKIIKNLIVNIWPAGNWGVKGRVVLGLGLLLGAKVCRLPSRSLYTRD